MDCELYEGVIIISGDYDKERAFVESLGWTIKSEEKRAGQVQFLVEGPATAISKTEEVPNRLTFTRNFMRAGQTEQMGTY